jgi:hypothetical protein
VSIANAAEFDWPGHWLARIWSADGDHAVVMFGSPSGPLHDPSGALAAGGKIEEGWLLARLEVRLPIEEPYGQERRAGRVEAILTAPDAESPLARVERAKAVAGRGLEGDRYFDGRGTFSAPGHGYQLTLVQAEVLDSIDLPWEQARRNIVTRGIALNALLGLRFKVGPVECGRSPPCRAMLPPRTAHPAGAPSPTRSSSRASRRHPPRRLDLDRRPDRRRRLALPPPHRPVKQP